MVALEEGDKLLLYTDGIIEARNPGKDFFTLERLEKTLLTNQSLDVRSLTGEIFADVEAFRKTHPHADDMTLVCIEIL